MGKPARRIGLKLIVLTTLLVSLGVSTPAVANNIGRGVSQSLLGAGSTFD